MSVDLERAAAFFRRSGYPELGDETAALARKAKELGAPERVVEPEIAAVQIARINTLIHTIYDFQQEYPETTGLSPDLAEVINEQLGRDLPDEVELQDLLLPRTIDLIPGSGIDTDQLKAIERMKSKYNQVIGAPYKYHGERLRTLGDIRSLAPQKLRMRNIGPRLVAFLKTAFAPPQKTES